MRIEKKTWPGLFQKVLDGEKDFEIRLADFNCSKGDILVLREWNPNTKEYTGRVIEKEVKFVVKTKELPYWKKEDIDNLGFQVISFK
ncbi:DUF3850 domain-containing protein [Candidatus Woesearchaeota archaeon]|nr:DUF3850 domain-containing protein [Candidatus Woesearchaeota archaeon]